MLIVLNINTQFNFMEKKQWTEQWRLKIKK